MNLNEILQLSRPAALLDLETTGTSTSQDRIWQIGITMHYPSGEPVRWTTLINPGREIPRGALKDDEERWVSVNEAVKTAPFFSQLAVTLAKKLTGIDFIGYNLAKFDLPLLREEIKRCNVAWDWESDDAIVIDVQRIYHILKPRTLEDAYKEFVDPEGFTGAHDAGHDVDATGATLIGQLSKFPHVPRTTKELGEFCFPRSPDWIDRNGKLKWMDKDAVLTFGKHANIPLPLVDSKYLWWIVNKSENFSEDFKAIIRAAQEGRYPKREEPTPEPQPQDIAFDQSCDADRPPLSADQARGMLDIEPLEPDNSYIQPKGDSLF